MIKLAEFLKPYIKECIMGPIFKLTEAILELLLPTIMALIINNGVNKGNAEYVFKMGALMIVMSVLGFGCSMVCQYYAARTSQGFGTTLRNKLFSHITSFSYAEVDKTGTSSLINRIINDVNQLQLAVAMLIRLVIRAPFICMGAMIMSMILDMKLALIVISATPALAITIYLIISRTAPLYRSCQVKMDRLAGNIKENLEGVRVIRAFAKADREKERFNEANNQVTDTLMSVGKISSLMNPLTSLGVNITIITILWAGGISIDSGRLSQGEIIAFVNYITQILLALVVVSNLVIIFTKASASAERINEVLAMAPSITDTGQQEAIKDKPHNAPAIEFKNVSFRYGKEGDWVLKNISISINSGESIGIIGGTGSGKSTFVSLIGRFYDAWKGEILIDGINVRNYKLKDLRGKIGFVPQKPLLFRGTVAENIRLGKKDASLEEVEKAAEIAQAQEFIKNLPERYDTEILRGGKNLSGGQRQRLTIARAVISGPEILILDDASSAVDYHTESLLRKAIEDRGSRRTLMVVSQRAASIKNYDRIMVFDNGEIAGFDTHDNLMDNCPVYREICSSQL